MLNRILNDFDLNNFWDESDYYSCSTKVTDTMIQETEKVLGYKLPISYIELIKTKNGGTPIDECFPTVEPTSWASNHIMISGIKGIGGEWGIAFSQFNSQEAIEEWGYPDIGIVICECPSAGHDVVMLDYRKCGRSGEPQVVHVDVEVDVNPTITFLAENFEEFIKGLVNQSVFDTSEEDFQEDLHKVKNGQFSPLLNEIIENITIVSNIDTKIRNICTDILKTKGYFALHADELSYLMYDIQFWLYSNTYKVNSKEEYLEIYKNIIAFGGEFSTGGYAPAFIEEWIYDRISHNIIKATNGVLRFTEDYEKELVLKINKY